MSNYRAAPITRTPAYKQVADAIESDIVSGRLAVGDELPTEAALSEQFGVTRSTVREGVRMLEQTGLIARGGAKRLIVAQPSTLDMAKTAARGLSVAGVTFGEVWEVLATNFPHGARLAAERADASTHNAMRDVIQQLSETANDDHENTVEHATAFLSLVSAGVSNRFMQMMLESLTELIAESLRQVIGGAPDAKDRILKAQSEILAAIEARDGERAQDWMRRHIDDLKRGYDIAGVGLDSVLRGLDA